MKVAYVTTYDSSDISVWSGLGYFIRKSLSLSGIEIECIDNLNDRWKILGIKNILYKNLFSQTYQRIRNPKILKYYAKQVEQNLLKLDVDVVFSPGTIPISYLNTERPIVFWADATFAGMVDFYPGYFNMCRETIRDGNRMEQQALSRCHLAIYASDWAAKSAIENYDVDPEKVKVVPFGANLDILHRDNDVESFVKSRSETKCKLLFIGMDWQRKGGDIALKVAEILNNRGWETELHVIGCSPPFTVPRYVHVHGFISKNTQTGRDCLVKLFADSHFFIMPSEAECFGVVFAEASAFGVPSLATDVGGIPTAIRNGVNGKVFMSKAAPEEYCEYILKTLSQKQKYEQLAMSSYKEYCERLNWATAGAEICKLIQNWC